MGMHTNCQFERFSIEDEGKFERRLTYWCKNVCMRGKSMLIFDKSSLLVGGEATIESDGTKILYKVVLPNITLTYLCINNSMCIMYKIWENTTQSVLYNMPQKWEGPELWLGGV